MSRRKLAKEVDRLVELWMTQPFVWGEQGLAADCLISLGNMIRRAHDYDPVEEYRGRYRSMIGALRVTREFGGFGGAIVNAAHRFSWRPIDPAWGRIGDIGIVADVKGSPRCGVVRHRRNWLSQNILGFGINGYADSAIITAWRII